MAKGPLKVVILGDAKDAVAAFREMDAAAESSQSTMDRVSAGMSSAGQKMTLGVTLPLIGAGTAALGLAGVQEQAEAKLSSTFESMGAASWTTTEALQAQASAFQELSTFGDESILDMQSVLLTFGNVTDQVGEGNDIFTQATEIGLDMSAALGQDLQSSAIQLGKALNDPIAGVTALSRVGVSFTDQQKEQIRTLVESGDTLAAQKIILGELENQFGGTAEAIAETSSGQMTQAMNTLGDAAESIGAIIAPVVASLAGHLKTLAERFQALSPTAQRVIVVIGGVAAAIGPLLLVGAKLIQAFQLIKTAFLAVQAVMALNPYVLLIAATVAIVTLIVKNWDTIREFLADTWARIKAALSSVADWFEDRWDDLVSFVTTLVSNMTIAGLLAQHWDEIKEAVTDVKDWIEDKWNDIVSFFEGVPGRISDAAAGMWDAIYSAFRSAVNRIIDGWNALSFRVPGFSLGPISWDGFTLSTPDIPRLHAGGTFRAPVPGGAGLAMLLDGERVGRFDQADTSVVINVHGSLIHERELVELVRAELIRVDRRSGQGGLAAAI